MSDVSCGYFLPPKIHTCTASFEIHVDAQEEQQNNQPHRGLAMIGLGAQSNPGTTVKLLSDKLSVWKELAGQDIDCNAELEVKRSVADI